MKKKILMGALGMLAACAACNPGTNSDGSGANTGGSTDGGNADGSSTGGSSTGGSTGGSSGSNDNGTNTGTNNGAAWAFLGRVSPGATDPNAAQTLSWPASGVVSRFTGTSSATVNIEADEQAAFVIVVDGQTPIPVTQAAQQVTGLDAKATHTLQLLKRNESAYGDGKFTGITLGSGGSFVAPPAAAAHRIEVIGDSISCGYGDLGTSAQCSGAAANEDSTQAYGPIAAAALNAEVHVVAWSGQGLTRSNTGDTSLTVPMIWLREVASDSSSTYDFKWVPQAVVINLGTNDFYTGIPDAKTFETAYAQFISTIRSKYGKSTHIYCAVGPMLGNDSLTTAEQYVKSVVSTANSGGDANVHYMEFPAQNVDSNTGAGAGCDYHPNLTTQRSMALDVMVPAIKQNLGW